MNIATLNINDLSIGDRFSFDKIITTKMVDDFAKLSGDFSPLHMQENFAKNRGFHSRVVHGTLLLGLISRLIGMHFPGENALLLSIAAQFVSPVHIDDKLHISAIIDQISYSTQTLIIKSKIKSTEKIQQIHVKAKTAG